MELWGRTKFLKYKKCVFGHDIHLNFRSYAAGILVDSTPFTNVIDSKIKPNGIEIAVGDISQNK